MKKITLMLCACAMAFAGLLVSCNNGAEDYINTTSVSNTYYYKVTGSFKDVETSGAIAAPSTETTEWTIVKGTAAVSWTKSVTTEGDRPIYEISTDIYTDTVETVGSSTTSTKHFNVTNTGLPFSAIYEFEDGYYVRIDSGIYSKVTLDGDFGDSSFTLSYDFTVDNLVNPSTTSVNKDQYSGTIKFEEIAE